MFYVKLYVLSRTLSNAQLCITIFCPMGYFFLSTLPWTNSPDCSKFSSRIRTPWLEYFGHVDYSCMPAMGQVPLAFFDCNIWQSWAYNVTSKNWTLSIFRIVLVHINWMEKTIMEERGVIIYWMFYKFLFLLLTFVFVIKMDWIMTYSWDYQLCSSRAKD
jgi:hypothetical protein